MIRRSALVFAMIVCLALCARAQTGPLTRPSALEVTVAWSGDRTNGVIGGCGCFWMQGAKAEASANFTGGFSVVAELAGEHVGSINSAGESLSLVSYLFGPRYSFRAHTRLAPFAQLLVGGVHGFDALFPEPDGSTVTPDAFAFAAGGGLNVNVSRHFAFRAFQADYMQTQLPNGGNDRQNHLRLAAGIILKVR